MLRLLTPIIDTPALIEILEDYKAYERSHPNPIYEPQNLIVHANWIITRFNQLHPRDFAICGDFEDGVLTRIMIGYKLEITWGRLSKDVTDAWPFWSMGLVYFKNRKWKTPASEFQPMGSMLSAHFEQQGYTKFYTVQKLPKALKKEQNYLDGLYLQTLLFTRYQLVLECIFITQKDLDDYKFSAIKSALPKTIHRPIMLISGTLKI